MDKLREYKGITLISLVITIIILLILAGISIAQLTGNGLFEKAKLAKEVRKNAQDDEDDKIQQYGNEINNYVSGNRDDRITQLENRIQELENKSVSISVGNTEIAHSFNYSGSKNSTDVSHVLQI